MEIKVPPIVDRFPLPTYGDSDVIGYTNMRAVKQGRCKMRSVKVRKDELLQLVQKNREKHIAEYQDAVKDYKTLAIQKVQDSMEQLQRRIGELKEGEVIHLGHIVFNLKVPENHSKDYDQVIKMLQMSVDAVLEMQSDEFAMYAMDDWEWKNEFYATATSNKLSLR
jgi:hypothetical protein